MEVVYRIFVDDVPPVSSEEDLTDEMLARHEQQVVAHILRQVKTRHDDIRRRRAEREREKANRQDGVGAPPPHQPPRPPAQGLKHG